MDGEKLLEMDPAFEHVARQKGFYTPELMKKIAAGESIQSMEEIPESVKKVFKTAMDITPFWHTKMQAAFQEFTDNAVSKTVNLPNSATVEDVKESYVLSYKLGCKGVTVYRDGSRDVQVLTTDAGKKKEPAKKEVPHGCAHSALARPKNRPDVICGTTTKVSTGCGNLYITVNQDEEGNLFEVFTQMGKAGGCAASQLEAVGRMVSVALRGGIDIKVLIEQLKGIRCPSPSWANGQKIFSCADALARALEQRIVEQKTITTASVQAAAAAQVVKAIKPARGEGVMGREEANIVGVCAECGTALRHQEGCLVCDACGYSKC
jgi:ribonucleoside-diphosphate reductase alpha chain